MKKTTTECFCDRCGGKLERVCGLIIEDMSFQASGYDPRGSGGAGHKGLEFCYACSTQFYEWVFRREKDLTPSQAQPTPSKQEKM